MIQPYGRGCFTFENVCMQHGHYIHVRDPTFDGPTSDAEIFAEVKFSHRSFISFLSYLSFQRIFIRRAFLFFIDMLYYIN